MKRKHLPVLVLALAVISSCGQNGLQQTDTTGPYKPVMKIRAGTFIDSVLNKMSLSAAQVRAHTGIDTIITNNSNIVFKGDTVFYPRSADPVVIIRYDDRNCSGKFLLVYQADHNTDKVLLSVDCDRDADAGYNLMTYKMLSDTSFYTQETYVERGAGVHDKETMIRTEYFIGDTGKLIAKKEKPKVRSIEHEGL